MSRTSLSMRALLPAGLLFAGWMAAAAPAGAQEDPFSGQILTLNEPKEPLPPSTNPRYRPRGDGTVMDLQENLVWARQDSYQTNKEWINWHDAQKYIQKLNEEKFGGASNWRLPTRKELGSLFDKNSSIPWVYYWTKNEVHLDPVFGWSHCCYWTSEEYRDEMAWGFNFIRGKPYLSMKGGIQKSLTAVRPVRDMTPEERAEAETLRAELPGTAAAP